MSVHFHIDNTNRCATISIDGRFTLQTQREFSSAYKAINEPLHSLVIDLKDVVYLDSSALGMLLQAKEHVGLDGCRITILVSQGVVSEVLSSNNFSKIFQVQLSESATNWL